MNKRFLSLALLAFVGTSFAQVGVGTHLPDNSAMLDIQSTDNDYKGILLPRIPLKSVTDNTLINHGEVAQSLLVYNTTTNSEVSAGYYYWFGSQWVRILSSQDKLELDTVVNKEMAVDLQQQTLYVLDSKNEIVSVPLSEINLLSPMRSYEQGRYVYRDEQGNETTIDVVNDVIDNITSIVGDKNAIIEIYNAIAEHGKRLFSRDGSLVVENGEKAVLNSASIQINRGGVTTAKLADNAVTTKKLAPSSVGNDNLIKGSVSATKIANHSVLESHLFSDVRKVGYVPVVQPDGSVKYQSAVGVIHGSALKVDQSLAVTGNASQALLREISLSVNTDGIDNKHIKNRVITANKMNSSGSEVGDVLVATGDGAARYEPMSGLLEDYMQKDISSDGSLVVVNGVNTVFGKEAMDVAITINKGGVNSKHIAYQSIQTDNVAQGAITSAKLSAGQGEQNRVAISFGSKGEVEYRALKADDLTQKGNITTDDIVVVDQRQGATLRDINISIADASIAASKLTALDAPVGAVATVGPNSSVSYLPIEASSIGKSQDIVTDGVVVVLDDDHKVSKTASGAVLKKVSLAIANQGINESKLASDAVTNAKIAPGAVSNDKINSASAGGLKRVLVSAENNTTQWVELDEIVLNTSGDLTTDQIIQISNTTQNGQGALLKDVKLSIAEQSIGINKLSSQDPSNPTQNKAKDLVMLTDGKGGFLYNTIASVQADGEDLSLENPLEFTDKTTGIKSVLAPVKIGVKDLGITTDKLANQAVTVSKIASESSPLYTVLSADGEGGAFFDKLNKGAFENNAQSLSSDASITVSNTANKALMEPITLKVAEQGIQNVHIANNQVTTNKISSKQNNTNAISGYVLSADGKGNTVFSSLDQVATTQGKALWSGGSLLITNAENAVLQKAKIDIAPQGVQTSHLKDKAVLQTKIGSGEYAKGFVLSSDGEGGAVFSNIGEVLKETASDLIGVQKGGISVLGGTKALLKDVNLKITPLGVNNTMITNYTISPNKLDGSNTSKAQVLMSNGDNTVGYADLVVAGKKVSSDPSLLISGTNPAKAVLSDINIKIAEAGVLTKHIGAQQVQAQQLGSQGLPPEYIGVTDGKGAVHYQPIADILGSIEVPQPEFLGNLAVSYPLTFPNSNTQMVFKTIGHDVTIELAEKSISAPYLATAAVSSEKLADSSVLDKHIATGALSLSKIQLPGWQTPVGSVITYSGDGVIEWKRPSITYTMPVYIYTQQPVKHASRNVYQEYVQQMSAPMVTNPGASKEIDLSDDVLPSSAFDYLITYYDQEIFEEVRVSDQGVIEYTIKSSVPSQSTGFMNIVLKSK